MAEIIAWDSCIIIDAIQKHSERYQYIQPMVNKAESGDLRIIVSTVSLAEVRYCKEFSSQSISQEDQDETIKRWFDNHYVIKRNVDMGVSELAVTLGRKYSSHKITPLDSIILATASMWEEVDTFVTYDNGKDGSSGLLSLDGMIGNPALRIKRPEEYSQQNEIVF